jgi:cysteinyl-tRNA synthetase, unknown class
MKKHIVALILLSMLLATCSKEKRSVRTGRKMQDFIVEISKYAKADDPDFAIIPQNGEELLFYHLDGEDRLDERLISAIDGIGVEEVFYNGDFAADDYRLEMLLQAKTRIPVLVADYLNNDNNLDLAHQYAEDAGFIAFPRVSANYDYWQIPAVVNNANTNNSTKVADAKNYLYLISQDGFTDKTAFLDAIRQTNFDLVIIDAFYGDEPFTTDEIASLKTKANGGTRMVIGYMSVGSAENYRYYWKDDWKLHKPNWLKKEYDGYSNEIWVKFWKKEWRDIIYGNDESYTKKLLKAGFDGAYLDNVEAYYSLYFDE